jgi:hypothetical protein
VRSQDALSPISAEPDDHVQAAGPQVVAFSHLDVLGIQE